MKNIGVLISGSGYLLSDIIDNKKKKEQNYKIVSVISDSSCFALERAKQNDIPAYLLQGKQNNFFEKVNENFLSHKVNFIIMIDFFMAVPSFFCKKWEDKIIGLYPTILPNYQSINKIGIDIHKAVLKSGDKVSGATSFLVGIQDKDKKIIIQESCPVYIDDTPELLAHRISTIEKNILIKTIVQKISI